MSTNDKQLIIKEHLKFYVRTMKNSDGLEAVMQLLKLELDEEKNKENEDCSNF